MAGRSYTRLTNGRGNRITANLFNTIYGDLEQDDTRLDTKASAAEVADLSSRVSAIEAGGGSGEPVTVIDGGAPDSTYGG